MTPAKRMALAIASLLAGAGLACAAHAETAAAAPKAANPAPAANAREQAGLDVLAKLGWGTNADTREMDEDLWRIINEANFGVIWSRPGLSLRDRELVSMSVLIAEGSPGVSHMFQNAHAVGITDTEIKEAILQTIPYAGLPKALQAMAAFKKIQASQTPKP